MDQETRLRFIAIFNEFPALWNKSCKEFRLFQKKLQYRNQIWVDVMRRFGEEGIAVSEERLRQAWVHLRNEFIRYKFPNELRPGKNLEDSLHETLNNMFQQLFREDSLRESVFLEPGNAQFKHPGEKWEPNNPTFTQISVVQDSVAQLFDSSAYPNFEAMDFTGANQATYQELSLLNNARIGALNQGTVLPGYEAQPTETDLSKVSVACQTEEYLLRKVSIPRPLPHFHELTSIRITFSQNEKGRYVSLEKPDSVMNETVYDEVATLKEAAYDEVASMNWSQDSSKIFQAL